MITLTEYEQQLVTNADVLLAKNSIIKKVYDMFGVLSETYQQHMLNDETTGAKISRGENYLGLPYVMLDYPRHFGKTDICAIRTFFWWGNYFSITLQLAGSYQQKYEQHLQHAISKGLLDDWFISSLGDAWNHRFEHNYLPVDKRQNYKLNEVPFIKVAAKISLEQWSEAEEFLSSRFLLLMNILR